MKRGKDICPKCWHEDCRGNCESAADRARRERLERAQAAADRLRRERGKGGRR
jgi:hypothetical protein